MSMELPSVSVGPQLEQPIVVELIRNTATNIREKLGRIAAASLFIACNTVGIYAIEETILPVGASADALGYPLPGDAEAPCYPPSVVRDSHGNFLRCSNYDWRVPTKDSDGNITGWPEWTGRGYGARNCTDYVAWRLLVAGVPSNKVRGLGNGGQWFDSAPAAMRTTEPKAWDAAVVPGNPGHVAFIDAINADGTITVSEYNHDKQGHGDVRTGRPQDLGFTKYVDFGVHPDSTPPPPPLPPATPPSASTIPPAPPSTRVTLIRLGLPG